MKYSDMTDRTLSNNYYMICVKPHIHKLQFLACDFIANWMFWFWIVAATKQEIQ